MIMISIADSVTTVVDHCALLVSPLDRMLTFTVAPVLLCVCDRSSLHITEFSEEREWI